MLWLAFAAFLAVIVAGTVVAVVRGVRLWRTAKAAGGRFTGELERISAAAAEIESHLAAAEASTARLREATEELRRSRARLDVQLEALREARSTLSRLAAVLPSSG
jgi:ABC-type multidrug transport system fused ATPase/permease subunit